jgi:hypothetical protein
MMRRIVVIGRGGESQDREVDGRCTLRVVVMVVVVV